MKNFYSIKSNPEKYGYISKDCWTLKYEEVPPTMCYFWVLRNNKKNIVDYGLRRIIVAERNNFQIRC